MVAGKLFPAAYEEVLALPGVGPYTAAAIASIALGLPHAAVDGNVVRLVSRLTNDASEITSPAARRRFAEEAARLLDPRRPGDFNQAMMELGATICLPRTPACGACPMVKFCAARAAGTERELPVKLKKPETREVTLDLAILERGDCVFLLKRSPAERRLADFWELPAKQLFPRLKAREAGGISPSDRQRPISSYRLARENRQAETAEPAGGRLGADRGSAPDSADDRYQKSACRARDILISSRTFPK